MAKPNTVYRVMTWEGITRTVEARIRDGAINSRAGDASVRNEGGGWNGTRDLPHALDMLRAGWPEGTGRMIAGLDAHKTEQREIRPDMPLDYAGFFPCVPAYVAGEDQCMFNIEEDQRATRSIVLVVQINYHCQVPARSAEEYARNVAGIVASLETTGIGVAVLGIDRTNANSGQMAAGVWIRSFDAPLDLARIAFSMHPGFFRRALFAVRERDAELVGIGATDAGYGHPVTLTPEDVQDVMGYVGDYIILPHLQNIYQSRDMAVPMREAVEKAAYKAGEGV